MDAEVNVSPASTLRQVDFGLAAVPEVSYLCVARRVDRCLRKRHHLTGRRGDELAGWAGRANVRPRFGTSPSRRSPALDVVVILDDIFEP